MELLAKTISEINTFWKRQWKLAARWRNQVGNVLRPTNGQRPRAGPTPERFAKFSRITMATQKPAKINRKRESQAVAEQNAKELETAAGQGRQTGDEAMSNLNGEQAESQMLLLAHKEWRFPLITRRVTCRAQALIGHVLRLGHPPADCTRCE